MVLREFDFVHVLANYLYYIDVTLTSWVDSRRV